MRNKSAAYAVPPLARRRRSIRFIAVTIASFAGFASLAVLARHAAFFPSDLIITRLLQRFDSWLKAVMVLVSWPGYMPQSLVLVVIAAAALALKRLRWEALAVIVAAAFEELLNLLVKTLVHRPRPSADLVHVLKSLGGYSFPSGHVMFYTVFFGFLFYLAYALMPHSRARTAALALNAAFVALVGVARIYLGEHWFSDAMGAYLLGAITLFVSVQFYRWGKNRSFFKKS